MKDHKKGSNRVCKLLEMVWTTKDGFESGKKFCLTKTTGECRNGFFPRKILVVFKKTKTSTWHECRRLCDEKEKCDYFKWKVNLQNTTNIFHFYIATQVDTIYFRRRSYHDRVMSTLRSHHMLLWLPPALLYLFIISRS